MLGPGLESEIFLQKENSYELEIDRQLQQLISLSSSQIHAQIKIT